MIKEAELVKDLRGVNADELCILNAIQKKGEHLKKLNADVQKDFGDLQVLLRSMQVELKHKRYSLDNPDVQELLKQIKLFIHFFDRVADVVRALYRKTKDYAEELMLRELEKYCLSLRNSLVSLINEIKDTNRLPVEMTMMEKLYAMIARAKEATWTGVSSDLTFTLHAYSAKGYA